MRDLIQWYTKLKSNAKLVSSYIQKSNSLWILHFDNGIEMDANSSTTAYTHTHTCIFSSYTKDRWAKINYTPEVSSHTHKRTHETVCKTFFFQKFIQCTCRGRFTTRNKCALKRFISSITGFSSVDLKKMVRKLLQNDKLINGKPNAKSPSTLNDD